MSPYCAFIKVSFNQALPWIGYTKLYRKDKVVVFS
jgi:hypothetical protein